MRPLTHFGQEFCGGFRRALLRLVVDMRDPESDLVPLGPDTFKYRYLNTQVEKRWLLTTQSCPVNLQQPVSNVLFKL